MGVSSCTGSLEWKEQQTVILVIDEQELTANSRTFSAPQDSISGETLTLLRIQTHSFSTVFLITSKTGKSRTNS